MPDHVTAARTGPAVVGLLLAVLSWFAATDLGGVAAGIGYAAAIVVVLGLVVPWVLDRAGDAPAWVPPAVAGVVVVVLVAGFLVVPSAVTPGVAHAIGVGSDRADALDVTATRLRHGAYPWAATTYLGNPLSPLPGSVLLALPVVAVGLPAATQNVLWTLALLPVLAGGRRPRVDPTVWWAVVVLGGLEVAREFVIGDDLVVASVPALAATAWTLRAARAGSTGRLVAAAAVLGLTTCTRPHVALVVVVVAAAVAATAGRRRAAVVGGVAAGVWALLIGPFLLAGTARFTPLHVAAKVTGERGLSPAIALVALGALAVLLAALAVVRPSTPAAVAWCCAAVLAAPAGLSLARSLLTGGEPADLTLGAAAVPFAVAALTWVRPAPTVQAWTPPSP